MKTMRVRIVLGVSAVIALIIGLILIVILFGGINLTEYITQLAVGLTLLILGVIYWTFRPRIDKWVESKAIGKSVDSSQVTVDSNTTIKSTRESESEETSAEIEGLKQYKSRSELPPFDKMLSIAEATVDMSGLDFRKVVHEFMTIIRQLIHKNIRVTFLILDPNSEQVPILSKSFHAVEDLKESLQKSIGLLCREREELPPYMRGNLIIRLYDYQPEHSIIIIDDGHENAWIKIEARPLGSDSNSRPSEAWYMRYDPHRYSRFKHEYDILFHNSNEYPCPTS